MILRVKSFIICLALILIPLITRAAEFGKAFGAPVAKLTDQPDDWFTSKDGRATVDNIVSWQNKNGGWWKSYDATEPRPVVVPTQPAGLEPKSDSADVWHRVSTIDNNATYSELRIVARAARVLKEDKFKDSFNRGLAYLFEAQYPNGGWPSATRFRTTTAGTSPSTMTRCSG